MRQNSIEKNVQSANILIPQQLYIRITKDEKSDNTELSGFEIFLYQSYLANNRNNPVISKIKVKNNLTNNKSAFLNSSNWTPVTKKKRRYNMRIPTMTEIYVINNK